MRIARVGIACVVLWGMSAALAHAKRPSGEGPTVASLQQTMQELNLAAYEGDKERFLDIVSGEKFKGFSNYPWMGRLASEFFDGGERPTRANLLITYSKVSGTLGWVQYLKYTREFTPRGDEEGKPLWWRWEGGRWVVVNPYEPRPNPDEKERSRWLAYIAQTDGCPCRTADKAAAEIEVRNLLDNLASGDWEANIPLISAYAYFGRSEDSWCNSRYRVLRARALADDFRGLRAYFPEITLTCAEGVRFAEGNADTSRSGMARWNAVVRWRTGSGVERFLSLSLGAEEGRWRLWGWELLDP